MAVYCLEQVAPGSCSRAPSMSCKCVTVDCNGASVQLRAGHSRPGAPLFNTHRRSAARARWPPMVGVAARALACIRARLGASSSTTDHLFGVFRAHPSVATAVSALKVEQDRNRGLAVYRWVIESSLPAGLPFFQASMAFCRRSYPEQAPMVLQAALSRQIGVYEPLFCMFLSACRKARPVLVQDALDMYARCGPRTAGVLVDMATVCKVGGRPDDALFLLDDALAGNVAIPERLLAMLARCCAKSRSPRAADLAERLFNMMNDERISMHDNMTMYSNLIKALLAQGRFDACLKAIYLMDLRRLPPSEPIFNLVLNALAKNDRCTLAMTVFWMTVQRRIRLYCPVVGGLAASCGRAANLPALESVRRYANDHSMEANDVVLSGLISGYAHCVHVFVAQQLFQDRCRATMPPGFVFDAMIGAYSLHGMLPKAIATFDQMIESQRKPSERTLTTLLLGCCHVGDLDRAKGFIADFLRSYGISCTAESSQFLVDLYGRHGNLDDAEQIVVSSFNNDAASWASLLNACRVHKDIVRAERVFSKVISLPNASLASAYVEMSKIYASASLFPQAIHMRQQMRALGLVDGPRSTTVQLPDRSITFKSCDAVYHTDARLNAQHGRMIGCLLDNGYRPDVSLLAIQMASEEDARQSVYLHSDKIALAFALMHVAPCDPIRLTKNTKMCPDCHWVAKRVSGLLNRDVYVRDVARHHHFRHGQCSCNDYW